MCRTPYSRHDRAEPPSPRASNAPPRRCRPHLSEAALTLCTLLVLAASGCGYERPPHLDQSSALKEAWNANNDPRRLKGDYVVELAALPTQGSLAEKPWTDTYWPNRNGGLADRWSASPRPDAFNYPLPSQTDVRAMSPAELRQLSPAEKYDVFIGSFSYPLVRYERARTKPTDPGWFGLCHGWAAAALSFKEPRPVTLAGRSGIAVPFAASDVKALLTLAQQYRRRPQDTRLLGARCRVNLADDPTLATSPECRDVNAGSFHIVLTNELGLLGHGFIVDLDRSYQVWNQPVHGFTTRVLGRSRQVYDGAAPGTVEIVRVQTVMEYIKEYGPSWDAVPFAPDGRAAGKKALTYDLELDASGEIVGGEWRQESRPDFLWTQTPAPLDGFFKDVRTIYEASIAQ